MAGIISGVQRLCKVRQKRAWLLYCESCDWRGCSRTGTSQKLHKNNGDPLPDATPSDHLVQTQNSMDICSNQINEDSKETRSD